MKNCEKTEMIRIITNIIMSDDVNELSKTLNKVAMAAQESIQCDACTIWIYDIKTEQLTLKGAAGKFKDKIERYYYKKGDGLTWLVYEQNKTINEEDAASVEGWKGRFLNDVFPDYERLNKSNKGGAFLGVPIVFREKCLGVLVFVSVTLQTKFLKEDEVVAKILANEIAMAFNRQSESMEQASLRLARLKFIADFTQLLLKCESLDDIYKLTSSKIQENINCRTSSIFFFSKDGRLERKYIAGFSPQNMPPLECYKRGQGLTGIAVQSIEGFGEPYLCNDISNEEKIQDDPIVKKYAQDYDKALKNEYGEDEALRHFIAIPLNGKTRSFGVLSIINKFNPSTNKLYDLGFSPFDEEWLRLIASLVSFAIANVKKQIRQDSIFRINDLVSFEDESKFLDKIANAIAHDKTNCYSLCMICKLDELANELVFASFSEEVTDPVALKHKLTMDKKFVEKICSSKYQIIHNIAEESNFFKYPEEAKKSGYVSMICLPLKDSKNSYGTFSVFTKFKYIFDLVDINYLSRFAMQTALVLKDIRDRKRNELEFQQLKRNEILNDSIRQISSANQLEADQLKNYYTELLHKLITTLKADIGLISLLTKESNTLDATCLDGITNEEYSKKKYIIGETGLSGWLFRKNQTTTFLWPTEDEELNKINIPIKECIQSELISPMVYNDEIIGFIDIGSYKEKAFNNYDKSFLQMTANFVAVIIQNKRFHEAALKLGKVLFHNMDKEAICNSLAEYASEIMDTPLTCVLTIEKTDGKESLLLNGWYSKYNFEKENLCIDNLKKAISWRIIDKIRASYDTGKTETEKVALHEIHAIDKFSSDKDTMCFQLAEKFGMKLILSMPIMTHKDVVGVINTFSKSLCKFFDEEINLLKNLAVNAAFALKNAELTQNVKDANDMLLDIAQLANPGIVALSFTHNLAHLLSLIGGYADDLSKNPNGDNKVIIGELLNKLKYIADLFTTLTSYSGSKKPDVKLNRIMDIIDHAYKLFEPRLISNCIIFDKSKLSSELTAICDKELLEQVFVNLFSNSIHAIKEKKTKEGKIAITGIKIDSNYIEIQFKDNGIGITEANLQKIFNTHFTTKDRLGAGFGLIIAKHIINGILGGTIKIDSKYNDHTIISIKLRKQN
jgi:signal transduction histidine kinase